MSETHRYGGGPELVLEVPGDLKGRRNLENAFRRGFSMGAMTWPDASMQPPYLQPCSREAWDRGFMEARRQYHELVASAR